MSQLEKVREIFRAKDVEIIGIGWDKSDELSITTSNNTILTSKDIPELEELTARQIKGLKKEFALKANGVQKIIIDVANSIKDNVNSTINDFIKNIVATKQNYANSSTSDEIALIINEIDDDGIKTRLRDKLRGNSMFVREFIDIIKSSYVDKLTGIFGQNYYQHFLGKGYSHFRRSSDIDEYNIMLDMLNEKNVNGVMFCDLNNFKAVNDLVSHEAGDDILRNFAIEIQKLNSDIIPMRSGGDEFIILGDVYELERLARYVDSDDFIAKINKGLPDVKLFGKALKSTVSKGIENVEIPKKVYGIDDVMGFKKEFGRLVLSAELKSVEDKKKIKEALGIGNYRAISEDGRDGASLSVERSIEDIAKEIEEMDEAAGKVKVKGLSM